MQLIIIITTIRYHIITDIIITYLLNNNLLTMLVTTTHSLQMGGECEQKRKQILKNKEKNIEYFIRSLLKRCSHSFLPGI